MKVVLLAVFLSSLSLSLPFLRTLIVRLARTWVLVCFGFALLLFMSLVFQ